MSPLASWIRYEGGHRASIRRSSCVTGNITDFKSSSRYDFYYMHCVNCSIFFDAFLQQSWISNENKARLLEWKGRIDLCMYTSRRSPDPLIDEIVNYKPKIPGSWDKVFERVQKHPEDGHASKLVRALAHGEAICKPYENDPKFRIQGDMWLQLGHMGNQSVLFGSQQPANSVSSY